MTKKFYLKLLMSLLLMALTVPLAQAETADVGGSTSTNTVPLNGMYGDYGYHSQMVYSQAILEDAGLPAGAKITAITFYTASGYDLTTSSGSENNPLTIKLGQPSSSTLSAFITDGLTTVSTTGNIWSGGTSVTLEFDSDKAYTYDGENLLIDISSGLNSRGYYKTIYWLASSATGASRYANNNSSGVEQSSTTGNYLPKITITYEEGSVEPITSGEVLTTSLNIDTYVGVAKSATISIKNTGNQPFTPTFSTLNAPFSIEAATEIPVRQAKEFLVTYTPTAVGSDNATLNVDINGTTTTVPITGTATVAPLEVTVAEDGTATTTNQSPIPVEGSYFDTQGTYGQTIYSKSDLALLAGKDITKVKYYSGTTFDATKIGGVVLEIYLMETDNDEMPAGGLTFSGSAVGEYEIQGGETDIEFDLTTPFSYSGTNNLAIQVRVKTANSWQNIHWIGKTDEWISYYKYGYSNSGRSTFLPKTTFYYSESGPVPTIVADPATVDAFTTEVGTPVTATVNVTGENLTGEITAALSGANADCFNAVLENGVLTITYNPTAAGEHTATVTLSSEGAQNVEIALSGTATAPVGPTITVPDAVTINTQPYTAGSASFTVTGANLTGDITLSVSGSGFGVTPNPITAEAAANGATVVVTYSAQEAGTFTGTITLTSEGAEAKTVTVTAIVSDVTYYFTVDEESLDFGTVMVGQNKALSVTIRNNGSDNIQPVFTFNNNVFTVEDSSYPVFGGLSQTYNIVYTPLAAGTDNGTVTISVGSQSVVVNLTGVGKELADYDIASSVASGVHNFGDAHVNGSATWSFTITNNGKNAVTPTITGLEAPFSTTYTPAALASGESVIITINFEPTEIQAYGPTSMVVSFPETEDFQFDYTLRGTGIEDTGTLPPSAYDAITYTWTDAEGNEHPNTPLTEIATDPDQMIALMREVYTNKNLPGNFYRGYNTNGEPEDEVAYPAIGKIVANYTSGVGYSYEYSDAYGWNIGNNAQQYPIKSYDEGTSSSSYHLKYFDPTEYKPNDEGLTLLLVEMRDNEVDDNGNITTEWTAQYSIDMETSSTTGYSYSDLRTMFGNLFKSVRVVPNSKRVTKNDVEGTLFKVDCDKMNRFFFLAKGRLRKADNSPKNPGEDWWANGSPNLRWRGSSASSPSYSEKVNREPFYQMFEQLSPVSLSNQVNTKDVYQTLVNMESYNIEHDCQTIPFSTTSTNTGHEFCLYGKESISDDCQDVRDLMFFVPDLRMKYWSGRNDGNADVFVNYYEEYAPTMGLYVIRQYPITGEQKTYEGNENNYELTLTWDSNLTDFVPSDKGVYYIYQVNDDGTYTLVGTTDAQTKTLVVNVAMQTHGQQVTYVIQGQDNTRFLSLQFSNEESFIIPGTDPYEKFQLDPNAEYYSRYNPADEYNYYANGMQIMGYADVNIGDFAGNTVNYYRKAVVGTTEGEWTKVAEVTVNSATAATLGGTYDQRAQADYQYGYQTNPSSLAVTTNANGYKVFDAIYDNFKADVSANEHPDYYKYIIVVDGTPADIASKYHSNEITVKVFKTRMSTISGTFTDEQIENDVVRTLGIETPSFDIDVEHSSKTEVLRYGAYRWDATTYSSQSDYAILEGYDENGNEQDISPSGQASNQGEYYSVYMNGDSYIGDDVYVAQGETAQATFVDEVPANATNADEYTYAPVVETFTGRSDYNTYGAPMQTTATGKITVAVEYQGKSEYTWTADGNTYRYYNVFVDVSTLDLPAGYEVAKVRAWRKIDSSYLGEKLSAYAYRAQLDANGEFMFDDPATASEGDKLGYADQADANGAYPGTFGAIDVESISTTIPMKFFVRVYFKKSSGAKAVGDEYYITEVEVDGELNSQIPTSIFGVVSYKAVTGVKYYNVAGVESDVPFNGVNIVVTTYDDGSRSTTKILK